MHSMIALRFVFTLSLFLEFFQLEIWIIEKSLTLTWPPSVSPPPFFGRGMTEICVNLLYTSAGGAKILGQILFRNVAKPGQEGFQEVRTGRGFVLA